MHRNPGATLTVTNPVNVDGTLAGHGTVIGNVTIENGGTLEPGGSIGTLTINGNLTMVPGSLYTIETSGTQSSKTQVNGTATLNGVTVVASLPKSGLRFLCGAFQLSDPQRHQSARRRAIRSIPRSRFHRN